MHREIGVDDDLIYHSSDKHYKIEIAMPLFVPAAFIIKYERAQYMEDSLLFVGHINQLIVLLLYIR